MKLVAASIIVLLTEATFSYTTINVDNSSLSTINVENSSVSSPPLKLDIFDDNDEERESEHHRKFHVHHRKSDDESTQSQTGTWQVFNMSAPKEGHSHHPSCILATMRASLVIPIQNQDGEITNKTIVIPENAQVRGQCEEKQQMFTLVWNNTKNSGKLVKKAMLSLLFQKEEPEGVIYLTRVWSSVDLFLEGSGGQSIISSHLPSQNVIMSIKDAQLWRTPNRFAYQCRNRLELKMMATTYPLQSATGDSVIVDPVFNGEAFLVFHHLHIETFRHHRFGNVFTHLNYDCRYKWAYSYMPVAISVALGALVLFVVIIYILRRRLGLAPVALTSNEEDEEEELINGEEDDENLEGGESSDDADDEKSIA